MVEFDSLELPYLLATEGVVDPAGGHRWEKRKVDDLAMLLSSDRVAAAIAIDYRGLDYYYYYLVDSVLVDLELGSDYLRDAEASVYFADQLPAT